MTLIVDISFQKSDRSQRVVLEVDDELVVGRLNKKTLLSPDPRLSRRHFIIRHVDGGIELEHLSKTNPTLVASENSSDFQPIRSSENLFQSCRIIAGFHRFVLTLERADTQEHSSIPEFGAAGSWTDVDDDDEAPAAPPRPIPAKRATKPNSEARFRFDDSLDEDAATLPKHAEARSHDDQDSNDNAYRTQFFESEDIPHSDDVASKTFKSRDPVETDFEDEERVERQAAESPKAPAAKKKDFISFEDSVVADSSAKSPPKPANQPPKDPPSKDSDRSSSSKKKQEDDQDDDGFPRKMIFPVADNFFDD
ncbi:MAG: FHA domain-containing protein [Planctomycetota bacterium]